MKKIWKILVGLMLLIGASLLAITGPEELMDGGMYPSLIAFPQNYLLVAWRLEVIPLMLSIGAALISSRTLTTNRLWMILTGWTILYAVYIFLLSRSGNILLIQYFRFNQWQSYLFLVFISVYAGLVMPYLFDSKKRFDLIWMVLGFLGILLSSLGGWWSGPGGFEVGSSFQTIQFAGIWLFIVPMIVCPFAVIINAIKNIRQEFKEWKHA